MARGRTLLALALALAACGLAAAQNRPPSCDAAAPSRDTLWPPNHKLATVDILGVVDPDDDPVSLTVRSITQDEPLDGQGDGSTCPDASGVGTDAASLRSERSGPGDGRVYHVGFLADDGAGGSCRGAFVVCVPHDRGRHGGCVDGGELFDSTGGPDPAATCADPGCDLDGCEAPDPDALDECIGDDLPRPIVRRLERAGALLARAGSSKARAAHHLARKAVRVLGRVTRAAQAAARRGKVSEECAAALTDGVTATSGCARCDDEDDD